MTTPGGAAVGDIGPVAGSASTLGTAGQTVAQAVFRADSQTEGVLSPDASSTTYTGVTDKGDAA